MRRTTINFYTDLVLLLLFLSLVGTGVVMKWVLPPGTGGRHQLGRMETAEGRSEQRGWGRGRYGRSGQENGQTAWTQGPKTWLGRSRHEWGDVHLGLAMALLAGLVWHLILHGSWIINYVRCACHRRSCLPEGF